MKTTSFKIILIIAIAAVIVGICKINDSLDSRVHGCDSLFSADFSSGQRCVVAALETHNNEVNSGWGYAIIGGLVGLVAYGLIDTNSQEKKSKKR